MNKVSLSNPQETVAQRIRRLRSSIRPAEQKVVETLLSDYPIAGLVPVVQLAAKAAVSNATVLRVVGKLGYAGYASFQSALKAEVAARLFSPADVSTGMSRGSSRSKRDPFGLAEGVFFGMLRSTFAQLDRKDFNRIVRLLSDIRRPVLILGGHFSAVLASHLASLLTIMRPSVNVTSAGARDRASVLLDVNETTTVVVFDYRRYQKTTLDWAVEAKGRSAQLILFTDQYLSPLASHADLILVCDASGLGRFDSLVSGHVLVDVLISHVFDKLQFTAQRRLKDFEAFRSKEEGDPVR